ncbi:MAG: ABC transporter permease [Gemmataceae bacterium]|nr:ABC transporter permease [Gemmataceae bacterium]
MRATLSLIHREFSAYFYSPIAYVVIAVFLLVTGYLFSLSLLQLTALGPKGISYPMQLIVNDVAFWLVFLFIPPLLTMRSFAEERSTGTLEMLLTAPLRDWQVVMAKFLACYAFYVLMWLPTLLYLPVLLDWEWWTTRCGIDPWTVVATYLGLALAGAMFLSLGMFVSSLVRSQIIAALVALFLSLIFIVAGIWRPDLDASGLAYRILFYFTVPLHFERNFGRGVVDTRQLVLYISVAVLCLFLTIRSLESRRWR